MKIRAQLGFFTALLVLMMTVAMSGVAFILQKGLIEAHLQQTRQTHLAGFAAVCRQALTVKNELFIVNHLKLLQEVPGLTYAYLAGSDGNIVAHSEKDYYFKSVAEWNRNRPAGTVESRTEVRVADRPAGRAVIGFSEAYQVAALEKALRATLANVAAAAGAVSVLGLAAAFFFAYRLAKPIQLLARGAEAIGQGRFDTAVDVRTQNEIGDLARVFNTMSRRLAILDELKDEFIANVSHDLRNPIAAIRMYADYMLNDDLDKDKVPPKHRAHLRTIINNAMRLNVFVTNILDAAKLKAGRMEYRSKPVSVPTVAENTRALFNVVAEKRKLAFSTVVPADLPPILADPEYLEQALANLVSNALKFTPAGGRVTLGARLQGSGVEIWVEDTGKGIAPEDLPKLFGRFQRIEIDEQNEKRLKGTGLGLAIVKRTVEDMGGRIAVQSAVNQGTRFTLFFPRAGAGAPPPNGRAASLPIKENEAG